ncbi:hypothetical protein ACFRJ8_14970 [Arthrobacter sp. NPDC056886]|uniref:hypothetical protein n=1 Tax=Arthrobacter sp. NPDC056886 TaxID=3345960 RepID=UPI003672329B
MSNLLTETLSAIQDSGHEVADIVFVGSRDAEYRCAWDEFTQLANVEYDSAYGSSEVATDLIVMFSDGRRMWRCEYDGSEWWAFDPIAEIDYTRPGKAISKLTGGAGGTLAELNEDGAAK